MTKMIKFPSIEQFRSIVHNITHDSTFVGLDKDEKPMYDSSLKLPILKFKGTVKLHGTNAAVCFNETDGIYAQSRKNVITPEKDNAGFATFVHKNRQMFRNIINHFINSCYDHLNPGDTISIYGEWCGGNIQKGVGITGLPKMFVMFSLKISPQNEDSAYWLSIDTLLSCPEEKIYKITDFPTYEIEIDFNDPKRSQNILQDYTLQVEKQCPVALALGQDGIGEGIVWSTFYKDTRHRFKVKGEKHSSSKVKTLASVDIEKLNSISEFVEYSITENRCEQGYKELLSVNPNLTIKDTGDFVRWVNGDVYKEELDTLVKNGLEMRDVGGALAKKTSLWFRSKL